LSRGKRHRRILAEEPDRRHQHEPENTAGKGVPEILGPMMKPTPRYSEVIAVRIDEPGNHVGWYAG